MEIVGAFACSHAGLMISRRHLAPPHQQNSVFASFAAMGEAIRALAPDALVLVGTDHTRIYPLSLVPQFTLGVSGVANGIGDAELPAQDFPIHQACARAVLDGCLADGIDLAYSEAMRIDHSFVAPLMLALAEGTPPLVPIAQNCNAPPLPPLRRSHEVGRKLARALRDGPDGRVVLVGTGGLSHWVGSEAYQDLMRGPAGSRIERLGEMKLALADTGTVNEAFDRFFLDLICTGGAPRFVAEWDDDRLRGEAGNGALELRNWLLVAGAAGDCRGHVIGYQPVKEWLTGIGIVAFDL
jgi:hypothetical protein